MRLNVSMKGDLDKNTKTNANTCTKIEYECYINPFQIYLDLLKVSSYTFFLSLHSNNNVAINKY